MSKSYLRDREGDIKKGTKDLDSINLLFDNPFKPFSVATS